MQDHHTARSFLAGPTLALRGIEEADAEHATAWRPDPFPTPSDVVLERLGEEAGGMSRSNTRLVACRHGETRPAGSVRYVGEDDRTMWVTTYADPLLGAAGEAIQGELLAIVVPWLLREREQRAVWAEIPAGQTGVIAAAEALGMRRVYRLREAVLAHGRRQDLLCYEALHPVWLERLGRPELPAEGEVGRETRSPAPPPATIGPSGPPHNAIEVGERLYLRPLEQSDAEELARWSPRETDAGWDTGRHIRSPLSFWRNVRKLSEPAVPDTINLAVATRADDAAIGTVALWEIDWIGKAAETAMELVRPDFRGAGYGTEAKHLLLAYAFDRLGLHMVRSYVWGFNTRSQSALVKQGYRVAGGQSWTGIKDAGYVNDVVFDLLAAEWRTAAGR